MGNRPGWIIVLVMVLGPLAPVQAHLVPRPLRVVLVNQMISGKVVDHTANHGKDNRIYSCALQQKRDLYIYLPPCYDPCKRYPMAMFLHGFRYDEFNFLTDGVIPLDRAITEGKLPPMIIVAPDGSPAGIDCLFTAGSFYLNSKLGNFEDFIVNDVYDFVMKNFSVRPEPEAHAFFGLSMGGFGAARFVMKYPEKFKVAAMLFPPLNMRWLSCRGKYMDKFDPCCWCWRNEVGRGREVVGDFGYVKVRLRHLIYPLYGRNNPDTVELVSHDNPIEMLDRLDIKPGHGEFYIGYGGKDQFNIDTQINSFLFRAKQRGIEVTTEFLPDGKHDPRTAKRLMPGLIQWLGPRLEPYSPK